MRSSSVLPDRADRAQPRALADVLGDVIEELQARMRAAGPLPIGDWAIGDIVKEKTRDGGTVRYELVAWAPHTRGDGSPGAVLYWRGRCISCAEDFIAPTSRRGAGQRRRCFQCLPARPRAEGTPHA